MSMSNNYFADYSAVAAFASAVNAKNSKIQATAEQELKVTEPRLVCAYEPMSKNAFADYGAIAAIATTLASKKPSVELTDQELKATEPQIVGTYEPISKNTFADNGAIAAFATSIGQTAIKGEVSVAPKSEEQLELACVVNKPSFLDKLLNIPITYSFRPSFGCAA